MFTHHAGTRHTSVSATTEMLLISGSTPLTVNATLHHSTADVFAVHLDLSIDDSPAVEWVFARDLLRDGLQEPTGDGDIHVFPEFGKVMIDLRSPHGTALLAADRPELVAFVRHMYKTVPEGTEGSWLEIDDHPGRLVDADLDLDLSDDVDS